MARIGVSPQTCCARQEDAGRASHEVERTGADDGLVEVVDVEAEFASLGAIGPEVLQVEVAADEDVRPWVDRLQGRPGRPEAVVGPPEEGEHVLAHPLVLQADELGFASLVEAEDRVDGRVDRRCLRRCRTHGSSPGARPVLAHSMDRQRSSSIRHGTGRRNPLPGPSHWPFSRACSPGCRGPCSSRILPMRFADRQGAGRYLLDGVAGQWSGFSASPCLIFRLCSMIV